MAVAGDKSAAKALMSAAGVPVVPGYHGEEQEEERLQVNGAEVWVGAFIVSDCVVSADAFWGCRSRGEATGERGGGMGWGLGFLSLHARIRVGEQEHEERMQMG